MATKEQIWAAADAISAEGGNPTLAAVRAQLGGGSYTDISAAMQVWRANQQAAAISVREPAPALIAERLTEFGGELWAVALELANSRLQLEREALEQARLETEAIRREATSLADQLTAELEAVKAELVSRSNSHAKAVKQAENARVAEQACQARLEAATREIDDLKAQVKEERKAAKVSAEQAAELKGRLAVYEALATPEKASTPNKASKQKPATKAKN